MPQAESRSDGKIRVGVRATETVLYTVASGGAKGIRSPAVRLSNPNFIIDRRLPFLGETSIRIDVLSKERKSH